MQSSRLHHLEAGGRDGCCPRCLLFDKQASLLVPPHDPEKRSGICDPPLKPTIHRRSEKWCGVTELHRAGPWLLCYRQARVFSDLPPR